MNRVYRGKHFVNEYSSPSIGEHSPPNGQILTSPRLHLPTFLIMTLYFAVYSIHVSRNERKMKWLQTRSSKTWVLNKVSFLLGRIQVCWRSRSKADCGSLNVVKSQRQLTWYWHQKPDVKMRHRQVWFYSIELNALEIGFEIKCKTVHEQNWTDLPPLRLKIPAMDCHTPFLRPLSRVSR